MAPVLILVGSVPFLSLAEVGGHWSANELECVKALAVRLPSLPKVNDPQQTNARLRERFDRMLTKFVTSLDQNPSAQQASDSPIYKAGYVDRGARVPNLTRVSQSYRGQMETIASNVEQGNKKYAFAPREVFPTFEPGVSYTGEALVKMMPYQVPAHPIFRRFRSCLWTVPPDSAKFFDPIHGVLELIVTPVTAYGPDFSEALLRTTQTMIRSAMQNLTAESARIYREDPALFSTETARGERPLNPELAPLSTTIEGLISLHQLFTVLVAEAVPGSADGASALHDIIFGGISRLGVISETTARLPMGLIGPMVLSGHHFGKVLERTPNGRLKLRDETTRALAELKALDPNGTRRIGVCPMASLGHRDDCEDATPKSSLQVLAEAYWNVFVRIHTAGGSPAPANTGK